MRKLTSPLGAAASALAFIVMAAGADAQGIWTSSTPMPLGRHGAPAATVGNFIYIAGGAVSSCGRTNALNRFDPLTATWSTMAPMPTARAYFDMTVLNGVIYAVGGEVGCGGGGQAIVEAYDPATNSWSTKASLSQGRHLTGCGVVNGVLYVVGGAAGVVSNTLEAYNLTTNTWSVKAPMPTPRYAHGVAVVGGLLYAVGGSGTPGSDTANEAYDPVTNTWSIRAPLPNARHATTAVAHGGLVYAIGGTDGGGYISATTQAYDPATNAWITTAPMPTARAFVGAAALGNSIHVFGGESGGTFLPTYERFTPIVYPGTGEDLTLTSAINANPLTGGLQGIKFAVAGNTLTLKVASASTFNFTPLFIIAQGFPTGMPPSPVAPNVWLSLPGLTFLVGNDPSPLGMVLLPPGGMTLALGVPPGMGGMSALIQGVVIAPTAANGVYAATDAHEIRM